MTEQPDHTPVRYNPHYPTWDEVRPTVRVLFKMVEVLIGGAAAVVWILWLATLAFALLVTSAMQNNGLVTSTGQPLREAAESSLQGYASTANWFTWAFIVIFVAEKTLFWVMRRRELARNAIHVDAHDPGANSHE